MASLTKRTYSTWRVQSEQSPGLNKTFSTSAQAHAYVQEIKTQGVGDAKIKKHASTRWQARIRRAGHPELTKDFERKDQAEAWAAEREGEIAKRQFVDYRVAERTTLGDLLTRFLEERLVGRPKNDPDAARVRKLVSEPICALRMSVLQPSDIAGYRDERLKVVKGTTVKKELELMSRVIAIARREWYIALPMNVASGALVTRPKPQDGDERDRRLRDRMVPHAVAATEARALSSPMSVPTSSGRQISRDRRKSPDEAFELDPELAAMLDATQSEEQALLRACRYPHWYVPRRREVTEATLRARRERAYAAPQKARLRPGPRLWAIVSFAIATAMRRGEIAKLRWSHIHMSSSGQYLDLPGSITKNGKPRLIPLSLRARRILAVQPRNGETVFNVSVDAIACGFDRALKRAGIEGLRFHDLRHEATSRLFERTTLRDSEIGSTTGHTDRRMLQRYYNKQPEEFVRRFLESFK